MDLLWLKKVDGLSKAIPKPLLRWGSNISEQKRRCLLRPGGLGDMVILTRAVIELGLDPHDFAWYGEKRNTVWLEYLGIPFNLYHSPNVLLNTALGSNQYEIVINTEQFHGLASLFAARLAGKSGRLIGFSENPRADLFDRVVLYRGKSLHELEEFKNLIRESFSEGRTGEIAVALSSFSLPACAEPEIEDNYSILALGGLNHPHKKLSIEAWEKLFKRSLKYAEQVVLVGAPSDAEFALALERNIKSNLINKVGKISFSKTVDYIRRASRLVSVDSGLVHVADFFNVPSDVVFPWNHPSKWGPLCEGSLTLKPDDI